MDTKLMLEQIRTHYGLGRNADFARFFDITEQNAYGWSKRGTFDVVSIYNKCPELNPEWLLTGEGEMLKSQGQSINGSYNQQAGGNIIASTKAIEDLTTVLKEQQHLTSVAQEQMGELIAIIKNITPKQ